MPAKMHRALERSADRKGLEGERRKRYVYGTMAKRKAKKKSKAKAKVKAKTEVVRRYNSGAYGKRGSRTAITKMGRRMNRR